jgi:hypothetical protein
MGKTEFDVYQGAGDASLRMATLPGAGLPGHVAERDWKLMPHGSSEMIDDAEEEIEARGFCFFKLV